jgi:hypothetical protein
MKEEKKKKCSFCEMRKKLKENVRDSYARQGSIDSYLKEMVFANSKPFKLNFKEGFSVSFRNQLDEATKKDTKKMTPGQMKEKEKISKGAKKKDGFKKYGKRAAEVRSRTAIKMAKKLKPKKK